MPRLLAAVTFILACTQPPPLPTPSPAMHAPAAPNVLEGIGAYPIGAVSGDVALVVRSKANWESGVPLGELWAVPLDGGAPRLLIRFPGSYLTSQSGYFSLARQLSPDGRRLVLNAGFPETTTYGPQYRGRLIVVDLLTSDARFLGSSDPRHIDVRPAWGPDDRIAFERIGVPAFFGLGIWTVRADGTDERRLCEAGSRTDPSGMGGFFGCAAVVGWAPDGRIGFAEVGGFALLDATGRVERSGHFLSSVTNVSWRGDRFAAAVVIDPKTQGIASPVLGERQVVVGDMRGAAATVLARSPDVPLFEARYRPGADDVLFRKDVPPGSKVMVASRGRTLEVGRDHTCPARAEWSTDGSRIVYLSECEGGRFTVRVIDDPLGSGTDRLLASLPDDIGWMPVDLAVVRYR